MLQGRSYLAVQSVLCIGRGRIRFEVVAADFPSSPLTVIGVVKLVGHLTVYGNGESVAIVN